MFKLAIKLAIVGLLAHAVIRIVPEFWTYVRFRDALTEAARFADPKASDAQLLAKANKIAEDMEVPEDRTPIAVTRANRITSFDTRYTAQLEYLPTRFYPWEFVVHVEEALSPIAQYAPQ